jgi:phenylalanine-4-hydroxylase
MSYFPLDTKDAPGGTTAAAAAAAIPIAAASAVKTTTTKTTSFVPPQDVAIFGDHPRVSVLMELTDRMGILHDVLKYFWKYDINVTRIESRPVAQPSPWGTRGGSSTKPKFDFYMDFDGSLDDLAVQKLLSDLNPLTDKLLLLDEKDVHWFPRHISELDAIANRTLDAGVDLESDHPGFHDPEYRERRAVLAKNAVQYTWDRPIPFIEYTIEEKETWGRVWDRMADLWKTYACKEFLASIERILPCCGTQCIPSF